jgi:exonuclease VII large subunit
MSSSQQPLEDIASTEAALGPRERDDVCWRDCPELAYEQERTNQAMQRAHEWCADSLKKLQRIEQLEDHLSHLVESHGLLIRNYALVIDQKNALIHENRRLRKKLLRRSNFVIRLLNMERANRRAGKLDLS